MNQSFKTLFFLKKGKGYQKGPMPIYVRITIDGKRAECSIQRSCDPVRWNQKIGRATGSKAESVQLNAYLDTVQGMIFNIQKEYALRNEPLNSTHVISKLLHKKEERKHSLIEVFTYHNEQFAKLVGQEYSTGTMKKFKTALFHLQNFILWKFNRNDVSLVEVNHLFVTEYEFYLKSIQKL